MTALLCPVGLGRAGSIRPLSSFRRKGRRPIRTASATRPLARVAPGRCAQAGWDGGAGGDVLARERAARRAGRCGARRQVPVQGGGSFRGDLEQGGGVGREGGVGGRGGAVRMRCGFVEDGAPANGLRPIRREFRRCPGQGGDRDLLLAFVLPRSHFLPARLWESSIAGSVWPCFEPREKFL